MNYEPSPLLAKMFWQHMRCSKVHSLSINWFKLQNIFSNDRLIALQLPSWQIRQRSRFCVAHYCWHIANYLVALLITSLMFKMLYWVHHVPHENVRGALIEVPYTSTHMWAFLYTSGDGDVSSSTSGDISHRKFRSGICGASWRVVTELRFT